MNIMAKKKKYKFQVELALEELTAVPFVNAVLFCKVHLLDGGKFEELSSREEVRDHTVKWNAKMSFSAKMTAPSTTGVLDPCLCRISVRKEAKGGRSYQKLGFANINLAEFAGGVGQCRRYLLEEHDLRHRQDNSMLKVVLSTTLLSGDPCFRTPNPRSAHLPGEPEEPGGPNQGSVETVRAGTGGLQLRDVTKGRGDCIACGGGVPGETPEGVTSDDPCQLPGHSRNSSSQSGYGSLTSQSQPSHSRQSSSSESGHLRTASSGSGLSDYNSMERAGAGGDKARATKQKQQQANKPEQPAASSRFDATRVDPEDVINDLLQNADLNTDPDESAETSGLQLYVAKDGSTAFTSGAQAGSYQPVVISKR